MILLPSCCRAFFRVWNTMFSNCLIRMAPQNRYRINVRELWRRNNVFRYFFWITEPRVLWSGSLSCLNAKSSSIPVCLTLALRRRVFEVFEYIFRFITLSIKCKFPTPYGFKSLQNLLRIFTVDRISSYTNGFNIRLNPWSYCKRPRRDDNDAKRYGRCRPG